MWKWIAAAWDTLKQEGPATLGGFLVGHTRALVRQRTPAPWSPSLIKRARIRSVHEKVSSMPHEWEGYRHVKRVIVFHDADKAGPHIETYLEIDGQCYNIGVKRLTGSRAAAVRYNNRGELTHESQEKLLELVRQEYHGAASTGRGSFLGQSTDHRPNEARESWINYDPRYQGGYGSGRSRTVLADDLVTIWKTGDTIEGRDWRLNPDADFYVHRPFDGVMKIGFKHPEPPVFPDRLHLKPFIGSETWSAFKDRVGPNGIMTIKEDGASFYWQSTSEGTRFWSPRTSKETGHQIDYTAKLGTLRHVKSTEKMQGMGELTFVDRRTGKVLPAHETGGLLNSHEPIPDWIEPKLHLYRIDRVGRKDTLHEPYVDNLRRIERVITEFDDPRIGGPVLLEPSDSALDAIHGKEGLVGVAENQPITEGLKFKPRGDWQDGIITGNSFRNGSSGGIAGTVQYKDTITGREYDISSGFTHAQKLDMAAHPEDYVGMVMKIEHFKGHPGRAGKFVEFHLDKGHELPRPEIWEKS